MHLPQMEQATDQVCFQGCCPNPIFRVPMPGPEPVQTIAKSRSTAAVCRHNFTAITKSSLFPNTHFTNHESIHSLQESFIQFLKAYPKYTETAQIDEIRAREYCMLSVGNRLCFDYAGIGLLSQSQVMSQYNSTTENAPDFVSFGLKHKSLNLKLQLLYGGEGSELESIIKKRIMDFLRISQNEYCMVFTANRSSAFKLVAESYPFQSSRKLLTVYDHESEALETMISTSEKRGARVMASEFKWPGLRIHSENLRKLIVRKKKKSKHSGLFVFPLQSRVTGANYSYQWMTMAQQHGWHVLLDACALGPKNMDTFGLSLFRPDFLICSFYKIFGENPTGFGCLFIKRSTAQLLENSTDAGTVSIVPVKNVFSFPGTDIDIEQKTELLRNQDSVDKSVSQADPNIDQQSQNKISEGNEVCDTVMPEKESITAERKLESSEKEEIEKHVIAHERHAKNESSNIECRCLDQIDTLGLTLISSRGRYLINWLISALMKFHHPSRLDDFPLVKIYGPKVKFDRGQGLAFNIHDWKGEKVEPVLVQKLADRNNISLGHGFLHHIWFPDKSEAEKQTRIDRNMKENETERIKSRKGGQGISVVTVALTFLADFEDVYKLWTFIAQFLDADFVERERWRYEALNQKTIEV
ncbi:uncharacterized protein [Primulina huaijiensis]|uniref:uncharacterized protein isoform X1 n=1 Tax=Primulina huaijiensis TaxID=1492673 RepID=UPI003CC6FADB